MYFLLPVYSWCHLLSVPPGVRLVPFVPSVRSVPAFAVWGRCHLWRSLVSASFSVFVLGPYSFLKLTYLAYHIRHSYPTMVAPSPVLRLGFDPLTVYVSFISWFSRYLPGLVCQCLSLDSVHSIPNPNPCLGSICCETAELDGSEPIINTPPHLLQHPNGICEIEQFRPEEHMKKVRRYDSTWLRGSTQWHGTMKSQKERVRSKDGHDRLHNLLYDKMRYGTRWDEMLSTLRSPQYMLPVALSISITSVPASAPVTQFISIIADCTFTRRSAVLCQAEWRRWWETDFPAKPLPSSTNLHNDLLYLPAVCDSLVKHINSHSPFCHHLDDLWL